MEDNNLEFPFDFQLKKSSVSIIGIGGGAGRIVNKMQACEFINLIVKRSFICFDFNYVRNFLRYHTDTKFINVLYIV